MNFTLAIMCVIMLFEGSASAAGPQSSFMDSLFFWLALPICSLAVICCDAFRLCYYHGCWLLLLLIYVAEAGSRQEALDSFRRAFSAECLKCLENQVLGGKPSIP